MSETQASAQSALPPQADCHATLDALRQAGAHSLDPLRWHYLERLQERAMAQAPAVQRLLEGRLALALVDYQQRMHLAEPPAIATPVAPAVPTSALAELLLALTQPEPDMGDSADIGDRADWAGRPAPTGGRSELKSVRQFRNTWSKLSADKQLKQALDQAPKNAGPINSHMLVLRSLALMREVSPDYLNRFVSYADTLLCLEQAALERLKPAPKPRRNRG